MYSAPPDSAERMSRLLALNDSDSKDLYDFDVSLRSGRIKESDIREVQKGDNQIMTYKEWKAKSKSRVIGDNLDVANFEKQNPYTVQSYKNRMERDEKKRSEIMSIKDVDKRRIMIANNLELFGH